MAGRECHHCGARIEEGQAHNCWTTTEEALTWGPAEDLRDALERLRETAVSFGNQRIYASGTAIMFSRESCYFCVRPRRSFFEVCVFLGRALSGSYVRPFTDWLREAYHLPDTLAAPAGPSRQAKYNRKRKTAR